MPRKKKTVSETTKPTKPTVEVATVEESAAKKEFRLFMETYKVQDPVKYAAKEAELLKKLNQL